MFVLMMFFAYEMPLLENRSESVCCTNRHYIAVYHLIIYSAERSVEHLKLKKRRTLE